MITKNDLSIRLFSALEMANICGFKNQTAINWIKRGNIKAFTTPGGQYRVYPEDLLSFMESRNMKIPQELLSLRPEDGSLQKALVIGGDGNHNSRVRQVLRDNFPEVTVLLAFDGLEAGKILAEERPGLVILDASLPGFNEPTICKKIKDLLTGGSARILILADTRDNRVKAAVLANGADAFLTKPLNDNDFVDVITSFAPAQHAAK
ncbi:MAG: response regulator [Spirochaetia bacterium]|jgi:PleD family two-component response regulator|nr:response regulator [Spirochaetia bacterium]